MSIICVHEPRTSAHVYEVEIAHRWYALPPGILLPLSDGDACQLLFAGRPGGAAGPDVRDAVLHFSRHETHCAGDVEFHVRASDWFAHQHHTDARYNGVLLHVVLVCDNISPALRQDGTIIPMCSLYDLPSPSWPRSRTIWPCQLVMQHMTGEERACLLRQAGFLRFEQKAQSFVEQLHAEFPQSLFSTYDACLIPALAEALGYGRDRPFFRAAGQYLLGLSNSLPEPFGRTFDPPRLDASRLSILYRLVAQWRTEGAWQTLRKAVLKTPEGERSGVMDALAALRTIFAGLGRARADILICNVVLPFALAVSLLENDNTLAQRARMLYQEHPGLSSNRITRAMSQQLQLAREPKGACQQQGLHYIYQQTCRDKRCAMCLVGRKQL